jgi:hypothetical protein
MSRFGWEAGDSTRPESDVDETTLATEAPAVLLARMMRSTIALLRSVLAGSRCKA